MKTTYFFGSNTPLGFKGGFYHLLNGKLIILKGGAGTGKSTLLKKIADEAERRFIPYEVYRCSSDAESLDAVHIPTLAVTVCDGTSPHVIEESVPAVKHHLFNLSERADGNKIRTYEKTIENCIIYKKQYFNNAYCHLKCAYDIQNNLDTLIRASIIKEDIEKIADDIFEIVRADGSQKPCEKYVSAFTNTGLTDYLESNLLGCRQIGLSAEFNVQLILLLARIKERLNYHNVPYVGYNSPFYVGASDALQIGDWVIAAKNRLPFPDVCFDLDIALKQFNRHFIIEDSPLVEKHVSSAVRDLNYARLTHQELEKIYLPAMDWQHVNDVTARVFELVFNC